MLLTPRKRRQILKAVLPLLVIVWAIMPALPCCQAVASAQPDHQGRFEAAHRTHGNQAHGSPDYGIERADLAPDINSTDLSTDLSTVPPVAHSDEDSFGTPCADVDKNHNEVRSIASIDLAPVALVSLVLISAALAEHTDPPSEPPPPIQRRPLHLSKSVLLI